MKVLILGANSDMAKAIAEMHASKGNDLYLASRDLQSLEGLKKNIQAQHQVSIDIFSFDAEKFETHPTFYQGLPQSPDLVIVSFGYLGDQEEAQQNFEELKRQIHVNQLGAMSILEIVAADMEQRKQGGIIGISSVGGERGKQSNYIYGAGKAGFTHFLSGLRNRMTKSGVHVMTVKPGFVATKMTEGMPLSPMLTATPELVARKIYQAYQKKKDVLYVKWMWKWLMLIIRNIPEFIFKKKSL